MEPVLIFLIGILKCQKILGKNPMLTMTYLLSCKNLIAKYFVFWPTHK
jgi:hypothetical protein